MTGVTEAVLGEAGIERAVVWSAVGFGLSLAAFRGAARIGVPDPWWVAAGCVTVAALGVIAFARVGGGVLPAILLAYGPVAAVLFETVGPTVTLAPGGGILVGTGSTDETGIDVALTITEPLGVAVAAAVAVGSAGFVVGRGLGALGSGDGTGSKDATVGETGEGAHDHMESGDD